MIQLIRRRAFSLVELLVVISIIAVLIGMLLPAVQKARETANRVACQNNLKQLGLAVHNYHDAYEVLPFGSNFLTGVDNISTVSYLLPYIEQGALFIETSGGQNVFNNNGATTPWALTKVPVFICPSEIQPQISSGDFTCNYHTNSGTWYSMVGNTWDGPFVFAYPAGQTVDGVTGLQNGVRFTDITDGLSNTGAFAEVCAGMSTASLRNGRNILYEANSKWPTGTPPFASMAAATQFFMTLSTNFNPYTGQGFPWNNGGPLRSFYNHLTPPNTNGFVTTTAYFTCVRPASSYHPGGVNALLCDGSVLFVTNNVDHATWTAYGSIAGGETLTLE